MKLNLPKPFVKYILIAILAVAVFYLIYLYVKLTNDRVYDFAAEQVLQNEGNKEDQTEAKPQPAKDDDSISESTAINKGVSAAPVETRTDARGVAYKTTGKRLIPGKSTHTCMAELNTKVINNDVVKCAHDHYVNLGN